MKIVLLFVTLKSNNYFFQQKGGLYPIHIACAIPGEEGVQISELLLNALADPDARAREDDSFLNHTLVSCFIFMVFCLNFIEVY